MKKKCLGRKRSYRTYCTGINSVQNKGRHPGGKRSFGGEGERKGGRREVRGGRRRGELAIYSLNSGEVLTEFTFLAAFSFTGGCNTAKYYFW